MIPEDTNNNKKLAPDLVFSTLPEFDLHEFNSEDVPTPSSFNIKSAPIVKQEKKESPPKAEAVEPDDITSVVREKIIKQQMRKTYLAIKGKAAEEREESLTTIMAYFREEENKNRINEILLNKELQKQLNKIEVAGYKTIHSTNSYRDITWQKNGENSKINEIKNGKGEVITSLTETTYNTEPISVLLSNGESKIIKSYRRVDFPDELESGKGPLHLSMAVKDSQGENIIESKALYFSAHYNIEGNLIEISSPQPIKFARTADSSIGYIERDGEVYTLAITQGQYKNMLKRVQNNKGLAFDISQKAQQTVPRTSDKIHTQHIHPKEVENTLEIQQQNTQNQPEQKEENDQIENDHPRISALEISRTIGQKLITIGSAIAFASLLGYTGAWTAAAIVAGSVITIMAIDTAALTLTKSLLKEAKYLSRFRTNKNKQLEILNRNINLKRALATELYTPKTVDNSTNQPRQNNISNKNKREKRIAQSSIYKIINGISDVAAGIVTHSSEKIVLSLRNMIAPIDENTDKIILMSQRREEIRDYINREKFQPDSLVYDNVYKLKKEARKQKIQTLALQQMEKDAEQEVQNHTGVPLDQREPEELKQMFRNAKNKIEQTEKNISASNTVTYNLKQVRRSFAQAHDEESKYNSPDRIKELTSQIKDSTSSKHLISQEPESIQSSKISDEQKNLRQQAINAIARDNKSTNDKSEKTSSAKKGNKFINKKNTSNHTH